MRLIDADALKAYVNSLSTHPLNEWDTWGVLAAIDKQPTIPASPWNRVEEPHVSSPWHRMEEPPKKNGVYAVRWTYQGKFYWDRLTFIDGNWELRAGLPLPDCWRTPIEPPKEENK